MSAMWQKFWPTDNSISIDISASIDTCSIEAVDNHELQLDLKAPGEVKEQSLAMQTPNENAQDGVTSAEAITLRWTKTSLAAAYLLMRMLYFVNAFQSDITGSIAAYVRSEFESHSLLPVISVVSSVMGPATYMPLAKILNLFDRSIGFVCMVVFATIGLILSATSSGIASYCAAQVFYTVVSTGIIFCVDVITANTSTLRDRSLSLEQVAVLAASDHNNVASALAVLGVFGNVGGAIGGSVSGAIWTHTLPGALRRILPTDVDWQAIYDSLDEQFSYSKDTPIRDAISAACAIAQRNMLITGTSIMGTSLIWMFFIKDIELTKQQGKGMLF